MARRYGSRSISVDVDVDIEDFDDDVVIEYAQELIEGKRKRGENVKDLGTIEDATMKNLVTNQRDLMKLEAFMKAIDKFTLEEIEAKLYPTLRKTA